MVVSVRQSFELPLPSCLKSTGPSDTISSVTSNPFTRGMRALDTLVRHSRLSKGSALIYHMIDSAPLGAALTEDPIESGAHDSLDTRARGETQRAQHSVRAPNCYMQPRNVIAGDLGHARVLTARHGLLGFGVHYEECRQLSVMPRRSSACVCFTGPGPLRAAF